jgi:hypothetical protein
MTIPPLSTLEFIPPLSILKFIPPLSTLKFILPGGRLLQQVDEGLLGYAGEMHGEWVYANISSAAFDHY